jgi:transcriptional regulator with XRE-family HTH domain
MENFSKKLKELRNEKKLTCKEVAEAIGLTKNAITNYESGIREPSLPILKSLCDFYDVTADYLIGRTDSY